MFWNVVLWVASFVLSQYLQSRQKQENAKPAGKFDFPTATEGRVIPLIRGTMKVSGPNVTWYGDYQRIPIIKSTGGMFADDVTVGYSYHFGMMLGLCLGTITKLTKIWVDEKLLWSGEARDNDTIVIDQDNFFGGSETGTGGLRGRIHVHAGSLEQGVDSYLSSQLGVDQTPAYRGVAYAVWEGPSCPPFDEPYLAFEKRDFGLIDGLMNLLGRFFLRARKVGYLGTQSQIAPWSFELQCIPNPLGLSSSYGNGSVNTYDYNGAAFLYEAMTNTEWGLGRPVSDLDVDTFVDSAELLFLEGNGLSLNLDSATEAKALVDLIEEQIEGKVVLNPRTGKWELRLIRQLTEVEYDATKELNQSNIIEMNNVSRGSWDGTVNHVALEYNDRGKEYMTTYAPAHDLGNLRIQGGRVVTANLRYPGVKTASLAADLAWRELRTRAVPLLKCDVVVDRTLWDVLPCDVVYLYDPKRKIQYSGAKWTGSVPVGLPMRVMKVDWGQLADGKITLTLVQDIYFTQLQTRSFSDTSGNSWEAPTTDLTAFDLTDLLYFETPNGIVRRSKLTDGNYPWCGALYKDDGAISYVPLSLNAEGAYVSSGEVRRFVRKGRLVSSITPKDTEFSIAVSGEDSIAEMVQSLSTVTESDIGNNLSNLVMIGDEFLAPLSAVNMVDHVKCSGAFRGMMDSCPATHLVDTPVWIIGVAGSVVNSAYDVGDTATLKVVPRSTNEFGDADEALALPIAVTGRKDLPYPPNKLYLNGTLFPTSLTEIVDGSVHLEAVWYRRDKEVLNEVENMATDQGVDSDVKYQLEWYKEVGGTWVLKYRHPWTANGTWTLSTSTATTLFGSGDSQVKTVIRTARQSPITTVAGILSHEFTLRLP